MRGRQNGAASAIYVRVPSDLLARFDDVAQEHGMSRSEAIREAMKLFIWFTQAPRAKKLVSILSDSRLDSVKLLELSSP
jgi:metal-responsive CopG/Arc/MetJ family transcriptional regulator